MDKSLSIVYNTILLLNLIIVGFLSIVIFQTTYLICEADQAWNFLEQARYLPHVPWHVPLYTLAGFLLLVISGIFKWKLEGKRDGSAFILIIIDIMLCFFIAYNLNFSYKGLFLFLGVGAFLFIGNGPLRYLTIALVMISYIFSDYDIISVRLNLVSLQDYISFYGSSLQIPLYSIKSTLESLNFILVILFFQFLVQSKVRENKEFIRLNNELSDKLHQLEILQEELEKSARLKERNRLAHEIHDILGHSLTSISTGLEACLELAKGRGKELYSRLEKIKQVTNRGLTDIRRSVRELKSDAIERSSLLTALNDLVNDANAIGHQNVNLIIIGNAVTLDDDEEQTVYRIVQESMTNSFRHSRSTNINITLAYSEKQLAVTIADDGEGCEMVNKHFGLVHIEERIAFLAGSVTFETALGKGFTTKAVIPIRKGVKQDD
ncbi:MAG: sensor histidine kinase [Sphaerochaetaceae bacterium]